MKYIDINTKLLELWETNSLKNISKLLNVSKETIRKRVKKLGLKNKKVSIDLCGKIIGKILVKEIKEIKKGRRVYTCICNCGETIDLTSDQLKQNKNIACKKCRSTVKKSLIGQTFGRLVVLERASNGKKRVYWKCKCTCGKIKNILGQCLVYKNTLSCGCLSKEKAKNNYTDLTNKNFNRLTVIKRIGRKWLCKCICGNEIITISTPLIDGRTKSCGCYAIEMRTGANNKNWKNGISVTNIQKRASKEMTKWRNDVKKKFNFICQKCKFIGSKKDNYIQSHHIENFAHNLELRAYISNGITLCKMCHKEFHKAYGKYSNKQKVEKFLQK